MRKFVPSSFKDTATYYEEMNRYQKEDEARDYIGPCEVNVPGGPFPWYYSIHMVEGGRCPIGYCMDKCPGHATAQEACDHFASYLRDCLVMGVCFTGVVDPSPCVICGKETTGYGRVSSNYYGEMWFLCDTHRTPRIIKERFSCQITPWKITMGFTPLKRKRR